MVYQRPTNGKPSHTIFPPEKWSPGAARRGLKPPPDYRGFLAKLTRRGNYFPLVRSYCQTLGLEAGALSLFLANVGQVYADADGWLFVTRKFVEAGLGMTAEAQETAFADLARLKIAQVKLEGDRGARLVRLDLARLEKVVAERLAEAAEETE